MASDSNWYPPEQHPDRKPPLALQGKPGWWVATDGNWYPPELHPHLKSAPPAAQRPPTLSDRTAMFVVPDATIPRDGPAPDDATGKEEATGKNGVNGNGVNGNGVHGNGVHGNGLNGSSVVSSAAREAALEKVRRLGGLLDAGRLSDREFQQMRKEILGL
jgi:hypothetical protein